jgi:hypothetical protein
LLTADQCSPSSPYSIQNQGDADAINTCQSFGNDITIDKGVTNAITLNGIQQLNGSLIANGAANMSSLSAPSLTSISKNFELQGLILLTSLNFPVLASVQALDFAALPNLQSASLQDLSQAGSITITNTGLAGFSTNNMETVGNFELTANTALTTVNVDSIQNCTGLMNFAGNSQKLSVNFPALEVGMNMTFRNTSSITVPVLVNLTGQFAFIGNEFSQFSAPNLTTCGDIVFDDNPNLTNISLPKLTLVSGGFQISNNSQLNDIDGVPNLQKINGALDFSGDFNK